ncbi:GNAT family N-acetyltransferase [Microvirga arabica]|uniref:GNAT family N-acetyltransferase n=1 Tax=Microvirga arabica TaxID=1128671 RepID=A0ABV6Y2M2_9HYPH
MKTDNLNNTLDSARPHSKPFDPLTPTIFHERWWLEAATNGAYEEVTVSSGGRLVGRLAYARKESFGFRALTSSGMAQFQGPAVDEGTGGVVSRNMRRGEITRDLLAKLPRCDFFYQQLHRDFSDGLPIVESGFSVQVRFTYEVAPANEEVIWRNMRDKTRNVIRRAEEQTDLSEIEPAHFCTLYDVNLKRRGASSNYMFQPNTRALIEAAVSRGQGRVLAAINKQGDPAASIFYAWDDRVTYYLLTTRAPDSHNGAVSRLIWDAMREGATQGRIFDFDSVGTNGSVLFYTAFGGEVRPRYVAKRVTPVYRALQISLARSRNITARIKTFNLRVFA